MKNALVLLTLITSLGWSQTMTQPNPEKRAFLDSAGRYFQQASLPVYLLVAVAPGGQALPLSSTNKKEIKLEGHGVHQIKHANHLTQEVDVFLVYADGEAPTTVSSFVNAATYRSADRQFYGPGLTVTLAAKDEMSGVEQVYHAANGQPFSPFAAMDFSKQGTYRYYYYAVDRTGNAEKVRERTFTVDTSPPASYHNFISISSENVVSTNSSIYLTTTDTLSGVSKVFYKFDKENFRPYEGGNIPFQYLADGEHLLTYYSVDRVGNKELEKSFKFYLDKTAPIMSADVLGDKFLVGNRVFFSGRTKLKITAVDNKSGIKEVMYTVNDEPEVKYSEPFYLPNRSGVHNVKFRAVDQTNNPVNDDFAHSVGLIYVDLTGPTITHSFNGPTFLKADTVYIGPTTTISITGSDPEAGLKKLAYSLNGDPQETAYTKPIGVQIAGLHRIAYYGYDNVNNRNSKETFFIVDNRGPQIIPQFSTAADSEGKHPSYTMLYLAAEDKEIGADQITYSINGNKEQPYIAPLKGFVKNKGYTVTITAKDFLGNSVKSTIKFETGKY